jgi:hypothetical protein
LPNRSADTQAFRGRGLTFGLLDAALTVRRPGSRFEPLGLGRFADSRVQLCVHAVDLAHLDLRLHLLPHDADLDLSFSTSC